MLADVDDVVVPALTHWQHPSFFAYFPANTRYPSILGELLSAGLGVQGMSWVTSPACTELETLRRSTGWSSCSTCRRRSATDPPARVPAAGVIQGSASEATLVAILAARWRATGGAVNRDGDTSRLVAYATAQAHSSVEKGLRIAGIGTDAMRVVAHDDAFAMRPDALAAAIAADRAAGLVPFFVCATRGTTSSLAPSTRSPTSPRSCAGARRLAARRRGDERDRRARPRAALGQRRRSRPPTATAPTRTSGWASTSTATCSGPPTASRCSAR